MSGRIPLATALLLAVTGCTSAGTAGSDSDDTGTPASSTTSTTPAGTPTPKDPVLSPRPGEVIELDQHGPEYVFTKAGRYAVRLSPRLVYEVDAPDMWEVLRGSHFSSSDYSGGQGVFSVIRAPASKTWLPTHPCRDRTPVPVGPSVRDLAHAMHAQPALQATGPRRITIDNRKAAHVRITLPDRVDPNACVEGELALFTSETPTDWTMLYGGAEMWILEVDGERWVIFTNCDATCSPADIATLNQMAESVTFTRND